MKLSQTQLSNFMAVGGVLAILMSKSGLIVSGEQVAFILAAVWTLGWQTYNFYNRFKKGDITLGGFKKRY